ncbi:type IX secretion system protein PorQ [Flavobacterium luminosum]|uniref:Type IX secretion system protein PorQ n=1 Tax=Flavobacterium luminosum TaxID=2949086 RepID=A0ABT0TMC3_9FLAO|nr:type IX secretion system protein PorQ [Flavobacterium sp. HXWNR70]MCL9808627.1 type IX secretion system protein PorQ [Flavobacterium sp. HXWNR70]
MQKKIYILLFFAIYHSTFAQVGGKSVFQFLNNASSPRQAALGGKTITNYDYDVNQPLFNPATINDEMHGKLGLNYVNYLADISYGSAAYAYTYDRHLQTFHAGITYINYGKFDGRDEMGNSTGSFSGSEVALSLGYAYNVPYTDLYLGANAKFISSTLETYNSLGIATDLGAIFKDEKTNTNYGLVIRNLGTQITTYNGMREKLPLEIIAGVSQELENVPIRWHLTLENLQQWKVAFSNPAREEETIDGGVQEEKVTFLGNTFRHVILGAEILPTKGINFRLSYNFRRAAELKLVEQRTFAGISAGFGLRFSKFRFDYSYSRYTLASSTSQFGLMINL